MVKLELAGRLTRDAEVKTTTGGHEVVNFAVAVSVPYKEIESAFFDFKCWPPWSRVVKRLKKGQPIHVVATPRTERWEKEGKSYSKLVWYPVSISVPPNTDEPGASAPTVDKKEKEDDAGSDDLPF